MYTGANFLIKCSEQRTGNSEDSVVSRGSWRLTGHPLHSTLTIYRHSCTFVSSSHNIGNRGFLYPSAFLYGVCKETTAGGAGKICSRFSITGQGAVAYRGGVWGCSNPPPRNSEGPPKSCQTQPDCENCYKLLNLGRQHPMFGKKGSKILKLPRFAIVLH